jgi:hypothetical protein
MLYLSSGAFGAKGPVFFIEWLNHLSLFWKFLLLLLGGYIIVETVRCLTQIDLSVDAHGEQHMHQNPGN